MSLDSGINLFVLYKFIKELATPFKDTKAFELGIVDEKGKLLKKPKTKKEKQAYSYFFRFIFNIKRLMAKVGLDGRLGTVAAAMFLLKEDHDKNWSDKELLNEIHENMVLLKNDPNLMEEITNVTGPAMPGTGSDAVHWYDPKKRRGRPKEMMRPINGIIYLKRAAREAAKRRK